MGSASSVAAGAGTFAACFAVFGGFVGMVQPSPIFDEDVLGPFYQWAIPPGWMRMMGMGDLHDNTTSARARVVGVVELAVALTVLVPSLGVCGFENVIPGLTAMSLFFLYDATGHFVVDDGILPLAITMFTCSLSALLAKLLGKTTHRSKRE